MIDETLAAAEAQRVEHEKTTKPDLAQVAEGRRRVCLQTAVTLLMHQLLLPWEVCDYAKYLNDYLVDGTIPREEAVPAAPKTKRKLHS